jgi:hypothetical protein
MRFTRSQAAIGAATLVAGAAFAGALVPSSASTVDRADGTKNTARLNPLNNSGGAGRAVVHSVGRHLEVTFDVSGLAPDLPHAAHIHFGADARHECPSVFDDANDDFRLTTSEGAPAYGPVRVSLTTEGDTSPDSVLAVDRYPTAPGGEEHYDRMIISQKAVGRAIRRGDAVIVIHGVDYNSNGEYDFDSAGASDLNPDLPAEATDPAICGVLR